MACPDANTARSRRERDIRRERSILPASASSPSPSLILAVRRKPFDQRTLFFFRGRECVADFAPISILNRDRVPYTSSGSIRSNRSRPLELDLQSRGEIAAATLAAGQTKRDLLRLNLQMSSEGAISFRIPRNREN